MKLVLTKEAEADLLFVGDYIAQDNPSRAFSFVEELERRCLALLDQPRAYPLLPRHEASGIRRAVHGHYLIFYRADPDAVVILHILASAMDYERLFFP
jgi:toxin ParE1/3/4